MLVSYAHYKHRGIPMQPQAYVKSATKKSVNLTANADLIACAKENKINLSETFEEAIVIKLRSIKQQQWLEQNKEGIDAYNERIDRDGIFASKFRSF
jgi:antitoxin CcdA